MIIRTEKQGDGVALIVSDHKDSYDAEQDFILWAEHNHAYTPTAAEMEEDENGRWCVRVMKRPLETEEG